MATGSQYEGFGGETMGEEPRRSRWSTCLTGCLIVMGIGLVLAIVVGFWVSRNLRGWLASGATEVIRQGIDASDLPAEERQQILAQVERVAVAFRDERLSYEQLGSIMTKLVDSPLMTSIAVGAVEKMYFDKSGLSEEEKAAGRQDLKRFVRGMVDNKINEQAVDAVMQHIADRQPNGEWKVREQVTDEQLRAFLAAAKAEADKAGIAAEPEDVDPSDEIKRIVDEALNEQEPPPAEADGPDENGDAAAAEQPAAESVL